MQRFVILLHELPAGHELARGGVTHWDLMFEWGTALRTWALPVEPTIGMSCEAEQLADHRLAYLDYEGPVSGNRGQVTRWDAGSFEVEMQAEGSLVVILSGSRLQCRLVLEKTAPPAGEPDHFWSVSLAAAPTRG